MTALEILALKQIHESLKLSAVYKKLELDVQGGRESEIYEAGHSAGRYCGFIASANVIESLIKAAEEDAKKK